MAYATPESRMATTGMRSSSSARAMLSPVSSGLPSVITTLNCTPCTQQGHCGDEAAAVACQAVSVNSKDPSHTLF